MSVIRRKHTANFTTIGNTLFNDERLKPDEIGIIGYLLSRPHDWECRRPQLRKRFGYGRDAIKRVIFNGIRFGYIVAQRTHLTNGQTFVIYEIKDEPGPELTEQEVRDALSLGLSGAAKTDDSDGEDSEADSDTGGDPPPTGQPPPPDPATGHPAPPNPYVVPIEGTTKYGFTKDESTKDARAFLDVKSAWPMAHILSEPASQTAFLSLGDAAKEDCYQGLRPYLADCDAQNRKICDLRTYISERRWERFTTKKPGNAETWVGPVYGPQWQRWRQYKIDIGEPVAFMDSYARSNPKGNTAFPSEWPPAVPKSEIAKTG